MEKESFEKKIDDFSKHLKVNIVKKILSFTSIDSTNKKAKDLASAGAEEGTVILAQSQKNGRGRFDRIWESPEGGLYLSLLVRPKVLTQDASLLSLGAALAVAKTIELYGLRATIKWPNDVRVNGKKIAGILLESELNGNSLSFVIIGIGINLNIDAASFSSEIRAQSTSVVSELGASADYFSFLRDLMIQLNEVYEWFTQHKYSKIVTEWKTYTDTVGQAIKVQTSTESIQGTAVDIDSSGFLIVQTTQGERKKIYSGDCLYMSDLHHR
jgi:BirA family biotin operon repressor/biotin-[acetyl-CoA-carboxylase] ligase